MLEGQKILIVDDEENMREMLGDLLKGHGARVWMAHNLASARDRIREQAPDLLLLDLKLTDGSGMELLAEVAGKPDCPSVVMISAFGTVSTAVQAVRAGAYDFIVKPFNIEDILRVVRSAIVTRQAVGGRDSSRPTPPALESIVGNSLEIREVMRCIDQVAFSDAPVLIRGESGTGKELVARAVHLRSVRRSAPFMPINCAAIPEPLLESELFGYEKGAFSGASARHEGKIEAAHGGIVFLDEIADMSPGLQAKLLRSLEDNQVFPVGSNHPVVTDVRFLAATNRDLEAAIHSGDFREDLYFRLNVLTIVLPPLRNRGGEDIALLVDHYLNLCRARYRKPGFKLPRELFEEMRLYPWPGNVRELRNVIEKLVLLEDTALSQLPWRCMRDREKQEWLRAPAAGPQSAATGTEIAPAAIPAPAEGTRENGLQPERGDGAGHSLAEIVKTAERAAIVQALNACQGNRRAAAQRLGVSYKTLFNKLHELGIQVKTRAD